MFVDIQISFTGSMNAFSDTVRDELGQSILQDIFEPMLAEIAGLIQLGEYMEARVGAIHQLTQELQSMGKDTDEF
jgi:hypothetical protein